MKKETTRFTDAAAWFAAGNADERFTTLSLENLLADLSSRGRHPLAVYAKSPPFSTPSVRPDGRDRLDRHFEHYTADRIAAITLESLAENLAAARPRELFRAEGSRFGSVLIRGDTIPEEGLPVTADGVLLLVTEGTATPGWVYRAVKILSNPESPLPICLVVVNASCLEDAAAFFQDTRNEMCALLHRDVPLHFGGFLKFDADYATAALDARRPLVRHFPGCPFHGQVTYVLAALSRLVPVPPRESFLERMAALADGRS